MHKKIRIATGILCFLYFLTGVIIDEAGWQTHSFWVYALMFIARWPYNAICNVFPNSHFMRFLCEFFVFLIVWYLIFILCRAVFEMIHEIYLDKKRFRDMGLRDDDDE